MDKDYEISNKWMPIRELSEKANVSRTSIHYYYREGLLPPTHKTGRTMALYSNEHLECLKLIRKLRGQHGLSIDTIRRKLKRDLEKNRISSDEKIDAHELDVEEFRKSKKQRLRIIETAMRLLSSEGYHRTHISHITETLHISKGTFYLYFKNKNDLLVAVFDHLVDELSKTEKAIAGDSDIFIRMIKRGEAYIAFYKKYHKIFNIIRAESNSSELGPRLSVKAVYKKIIDPVAEDILRGQDEGVFTKTSIDPELMSYMMVGALDFLCYRLLMEEKDSSIEIVDILRNSTMLHSILFGRGAGN